MHMVLPVIRVILCSKCRTSAKRHPKPQAKAFVIVNNEYVSKYKGQNVVTMKYKLFILHRATMS